LPAKRKHLLTEYIGFNINDPPSGPKVSSTHLDNGMPGDCVLARLKDGCTAIYVKLVARYPNKRTIHPITDLRRTPPGRVLRGAITIESPTTNARQWIERVLPKKELSDLCFDFSTPNRRNKGHRV
jgi:hypothetical protein